MFTPISLSKAAQYKSGSWEGYSPKLNRDVSVAGDLEYDYWTFIETNPTILDFCERPTSEELNIPPTFSMWIKYRTGEESFVRVKYTSIISSRTSKKISKEIEIEQTWCEKNGYLHLIITEEDIRHNHLELSNRRTLFSFVCNRRTPIETDIHRIISYLKENNVVTIKQIQESLNDHLSNSRIMEAVCWLIYTGRAICDLGRLPLGPRMEVHLECPKGEL